MSQESIRKKRNPEIIIRQMDIDDISSVYHLGEELFTSDKLPILYRTWDPNEVTGYFGSDPEYCLVAEKKGEILGFIIATTIMKEGTAWNKYGYLSWIGVVKAYQRTNLGQRLYNRIEDRMMEDGVRMIMCDTEANNSGAISFFRAIGFTERRKHIWMAKTLKRQKKIQ
ncbi:MAG: GNAT family N-acetyltransferase [Dehalococcoidales bacterium]|nr:MAG: GNAT family N-acetyltransferase [Dehalococcoidales bacterium]